jgi:hypothetical protein
MTVRVRAKQDQRIRSEERHVVLRRVGELKIDVVRQISSTMPAVRGKRSLTQAPDLTCWANLKTELARGAVAGLADILVSR